MSRHVKVKYLFLLAWSQLWRQAWLGPLGLHLDDGGCECAAAACRAQTVRLAQLALAARLLQEQHEVSTRPRHRGHLVGRSLRHHICLNLTINWLQTQFLLSTVPFFIVNSWCIDGLFPKYITLFWTIPPKWAASPSVNDIMNISFDVWSFSVTEQRVGSGNKRFDISIDTSIMITKTSLNRMDHWLKISFSLVKISWMLILSMLVSKLWVENHISLWLTAGATVQNRCVRSVSQSAEHESADMFLTFNAAGFQGEDKSRRRRSVADEEVVGAEKQSCYQDVTVVWQALNNLASTL